MTNRAPPSFFYFFCQETPESYGGGGGAAGNGSVLPGLRDNNLEALGVHAAPGARVSKLGASDNAGLATGVMAPISTSTNDGERCIVGEFLGGGGRARGAEAGRCAS